MIEHSGISDGRHILNFDSKIMNIRRFLNDMVTRNGFGIYVVAIVVAVEDSSSWWKCWRFSIVAISRQADAFAVTL